MSKITNNVRINIEKMRAAGDTWEEIEKKVRITRQSIYEDRKKHPELWRSAKYQPIAEATEAHARSLRHKMNKHLKVLVEQQNAARARGDDDARLMLRLEYNEALLQWMRLWYPAHLEALNAKFKFKGEQPQGWDDFYAEKLANLDRDPEELVIHSPNAAVDISVRAPKEYAGRRDKDLALKNSPPVRG